MTAVEERAKAAEEIDLYDHRLYINRELSWLEFNRRCLSEADNPRTPLLDRVKFLAIAYGNMDEFFMIRVPGLITSLSGQSLEAVGPDGYSDPGLLLSEINASVDALMKGYEECWGRLRRELASNGVTVADVCSLTEAQRDWMRSYYRERVHPLLTPLALDISHPFPFISSNSLNVAVKLRRRGDGAHLYARVKVPVGIIPRFVGVPSDSPGLLYIKLEDVIKANAGEMFPDLEVMGAYTFRVTRNADVKVTIDEACDLMAAVETSLDSRDAGFPVMMMVESKMPSEMVRLFAKNLKLRDYQTHRASPEGMLLTDLWQIANLKIPSLREEPLSPYVPPELADGSDIFQAIKKRDWILMHPYESFDAIVRLIDAAAEDDSVRSIKICLYRIGKDSPIISSLMKARDRGKTVSVLMELRAKFDEDNNIHFARELEKIGVHVVYGPVELKVHSKLLQIVRLEKDRLVRYTHMGSGNYNVGTARQYIDISFLTSNQALGEDVGELFNALTGFFSPRDYKHLLVAPTTLKSSLIGKIRREAENQRAGAKSYIAIKCNGLVDSDVIAELYRASMAGVKIDLNIRGLCCLRPGLPKISENITVTSIVDRFLEHSRIYYFENGGNPEMYMGSSDVMPRNLMARVEVLFPVLDGEMMRLIRDRILKVHLSDNQKAKRLLPDGTYAPVGRGGKKVRSQKWFIEHRGSWHG
ncbi:MAG: polyphosphate kinase 1 [Candidatus Methanoplasma sp.]|nr:polyphosphate kinase 1 [Candidatus Methanoplasma sp.]